MAKRKSTKPRTRRDRRTLRTLGKFSVNENDTTLNGQIMILISELVKPSPGVDPTARLPPVLKAAVSRKEYFLKAVLGAFMTLRMPILTRNELILEDQFTNAKEVLAEHIAKYWGKKIDPKKLEQKPRAWEWHAELKLGYDPEKLPKAPKAKTPKKEVDIEEEVKEKEEEEDVEYEAGTYEPADDDEEMDEADVEKLFEGGGFYEYD